MLAQRIQKTFNTQGFHRFVHHTKQKGKKRQRAQNDFTKRIDMELELKNKQALALKIEFNNAGLDSGVSQD